MKLCSGFIHYHKLYVDTICNLELQSNSGQHEYSNKTKILSNEFALQMMIDVNLKINKVYFCKPVTVILYCRRVGAKHLLPAGLLNHFTFLYLKYSH